VLLLRVSTSQPLVGLRSQSAKPVAHAATAQEPPAQVALACGSAQARPHDPQFASLVWRLISQPSAAVALQSPAPALQRTTAHAPAAQPLAATPGSAHAVAHPPQWSGSLAVLAQKAPDGAVQVASGAAQVAPHAPAEQTWPAAQAAPHAPQLALSVRVSTSQPLAGLRSQSAKPVAHAATAHAPTAHVAVALGSAQARPQAPQFAALVVSSASHPLAAAPSQSPKPAAQRAGAQVPPAQPWVAVCASAQTVPHAPQLVGSIAVLAQKAVGAAPQVASGAAQVAPQTPAEQTWPAAQKVPHPPQLAASVRVSASQPLLATWSQSRKPASQAATAHDPAAQLGVACASRHCRPQAPQCAALEVVSASQPLAAVPSQSP
jgi:hypothetical protein